MARKKPAKKTMTEDEWLGGTDLTRMRDVVLGPSSVRIIDVFGREVPCDGYYDRRTSDRKLRLFACACCRSLWKLVDDEHCKRIVEVSYELGCDKFLLDLPIDSCRRAVEVAELAADEPVESERLLIASEAADAFHIPPEMYAACYDPPVDTELMASGHAAYAAYSACNSDAACGALGVVNQTVDAVRLLQNTKHQRAVVEGDAVDLSFHCSLLRDIIGNPFRSSTIDSAWLTSEVVNLAGVVYKERVLPSGELDPTRLAVLADILEKAGCTNTDILDHLRGTGPHVRGCWVVDLVLGKK